MSPLSFAIVSSEPGSAAALEAFCRTLGTLTGTPLAPKILASYADLLKGALAGELHVVWAPPLVAIDLEDAGVAVPALVVERSSRSGYHSALFTRADSPLRRVEDLSGARAAWVSKESASGYFAPRWHLRSMGITLSNAFSSERFYGSHEAVTRAVLADEADVGATHVGVDPVSGGLATAPWMALGRAAQDARVLLLVGPIPGDVIAFATRIDPATRRAIVAALLAMRQESASRNLFEATRFDPVPEGHLTLLRRLARFAETRG